jgi:hypothetical protein
MKTKIQTVYLLAVFAFLFFTGCSKDGAQGPAGLDGQNAAVYYSEWFSPTASWSGASGDWYFSASAPDLTQDVIENGVVLAYVWLAGDIYNSTTVRPLPAYALGANWSFLVHQYGSIEFTCDMSTQPFNAGDKFRFIAIPGSSIALKSAMAKYKTQSELKNMSYQDACKLFNVTQFE